MHSPSNHTLLRKGNEEFQVMNTLFAYGLKFPKICKAEEIWDKSIMQKTSWNKNKSPGDISIYKALSPL